LTSNLTHYINLGKGADDHSETDSDMSIHNIELEEFNERKPRESKPIKKTEPRVGAKKSPK